jgi:hypothetical protein
MILNDLFTRKYKNIKNTGIRPNFGRNRFFSAEFFGQLGEIGRIRPISAEFPENHRNGTPLYVNYGDNHIVFIFFLWKKASTIVGSGQRGSKDEILGSYCEQWKGPREATYVCK